MSDVREIFTSYEAAQLAPLNQVYLVRLAKKIGLNESEMRATGSGIYLFSKEGLDKIRAAKKW
ncbi:AraC family transcriptional regulator [Cloacibacillus evryensis]|uniref:AraC family transcriptional regulator n=1 Tax=Cloacibacillus evryensis TaxID=508460 RepID=UPI002B203D46|nr:AraC family transcriptional regulator [Cloacibacillus evryensis]MEA5034225.1 AraC family transcriptional regulator [Cloacibacillus evryensis]